MITQVAPIGSLLTQPQVPTAAPAPAPDQLNLWQKFNERLKQDPNLRMALLGTGLNLLRTPQPGQSGFDVFADAATQGINTFDQLNQRDRTQEIEMQEIARQADIDERRTAATEETAAASTSRANIAAEQAKLSAERFNANLQLARDKMKQDAEQFAARRQDVAAGNSELTGQERVINAGVEALITAQPDLYTNDAQGRARARLVVQGIGEAGQDAQAQARIIGGILTKLQEINVFEDAENQLTPDELARQAIETYKLISSDLSIDNESPQAGIPASITHPAYGKGRVVQADNGTIIIEYVDGRTSPPMTIEQFQQFLPNLGQQ